MKKEMTKIHGRILAKTDFASWFYLNITELSQLSRVTNNNPTGFWSTWCVDLQNANGKKMINEYVRERKIGSGSYGKVVRMII